jgi:hypothetical protein
MTKFDPLQQDIQWAEMMIQKTHGEETEKYRRIRTALRKRLRLIEFFDGVYSRQEPSERGGETVPALSTNNPH